MKYLKVELYLLLVMAKKGAIIEKLFAIFVLGILNIPFWVLFEKYVFSDIETGIRFLILWAIDVLLGLWKHTKLRTLNGETGAKKSLTKLAIIVAALLISHQIIGITKEWETAVKFIINSPILVFIAISLADSLYTVSEGKFPPVWLTNRLEKFNETGNIKDLTENQKENDNDPTV